MKSTAKKLLDLLEQSDISTWSNQEAREKALGLARSIVEIEKEETAWKKANEAREARFKATREEDSRL